MLNTFTVPEAIVSVYPTDANGEAITASPVWLGASVKGLHITERLVEVVDHPSGAPYGVAHHIDEEHSISMERLWIAETPLVSPPEDLAIALAATDIGQPFGVTNGTDYRLRRNMRYIVPIIWQDESDPTSFIYRVYYGVTDQSHNLSASGADGEKTSVITWRAEYYLA